MANIGPVQLIILLVIIILLFGSKRIRNLGSDIGSAIRGFKSGLKEGEQEPEQLQADEPSPEQADTTQKKEQSNG